MGDIPIASLIQRALHVNNQLFLCFSWKLNFLDWFSEYTDIKFHFKKIRPAGAKLIHTDGQTWRSWEPFSTILRTRLNRIFSNVIMCIAFSWLSLGCSNARTWTWQRGYLYPKQRSCFIHSTLDNFCRPSQTAVHKGIWNTHKERDYAGESLQLSAAYQGRTLIACTGQRSSATPDISGRHDRADDNLTMNPALSQTNPIHSLPSLCLTFRRRIKSRLPFAGIIRRLPYSTRFQDKG